MGLACSQVNLLMLTQRKADCELGLAIDAAEKMALTREQSALSREYASKLRQKQLVYSDANGDFRKLTYNYLMGSIDYDKAALKNEGGNYRKDYSMILSDYRGKVVLSDDFAKILLDNGIPYDNRTKGSAGVSGSALSYDNKLLAQLLHSVCGEISVEQYKNELDGNGQKNTIETEKLNQYTGENKGTEVVELDDSNQIQKIIDFYKPIFVAALTNGWTTEYNAEINNNQDYLQDALSTGSFRLEQIDNFGVYEPSSSLNYYLTSDILHEKQDSNFRELLTAWYNEQKENLTEKENVLELDMDNLSTELQAIQSEIQSIQSFINNNIQSVFSWGSQG